MTDTQKKEFIDRLHNGSVLVYCKDHSYFGPGKDGHGRPAAGCQKCWQVWWLHYFSTVPRDQIAERMVQVYEALRHTNEAIENGMFDFQPLASPGVEIVSE